MVDQVVLLGLLFSFVISLLITLYLVPLLAAVAHKLGVIDKPDGKLKKHEIATPYLGGVAVYVGFITALALVFPFENRMFLFLIGSTLLLFVGLIDDLIVMKPYQKFFGQIIATFCFLKAGFHLKENFFSYIPNILFSFFWILSVINAFNLVDVMDGLSTTLASFATLAFLVSAIYFQAYTVALLLTAFLGALLAFLYYNKPQAKIYLGDSGSLFIGGFLATVPFMLPWGTFSSSGYLAPIIILLIPFLEMGTLILVRTYKKIPFYKGSPDHFSIYLKKNGWSSFQILAYISLLSVLLLVLAYLTISNSISLIYIISVVALIICLWYFIIIFKKDEKIARVFRF